MVGGCDGGGDLGDERREDVEGGLGGEEFEELVLFGGEGVLEDGFSLGDEFLAIGEDGLGDLGVPGEEGGEVGGVLEFFVVDLFEDCCEVERGGALGVKGVAGTGGRGAHEGGGGAEGAGAGEDGFFVVEAAAVGDARREHWR